jgi:hypothetical protein
LSRANAKFRRMEGKPSCCKEDSCVGKKDCERVTRQCLMPPNSVRSLQALYCTTVLCTWRTHAPWHGWRNNLTILVSTPGHGPSPRCRYMVCAIAPIHTLPPTLLADSEWARSTATAMTAASSWFDICSRERWFATSMASEDCLSKGGCFRGFPL